MDWVNDYLKALKEYARDYVLEHTGLKVLALLITAVLWLSVASRPASQIALNDVPIEFYNFPESPTLTVSKYPTLKARVFLEGPRDVLESLRPEQLTVVADMSGVEPGVRVIRLSIDQNRLPTSVRAKQIEPPTISVTVERVIEKEVPVVPRFEGQPPAGYEVTDWQISPDTVRVSGAESQVRDITEVSTETVRLTDKTEPFSQEVATDIGSPNLSISDERGRKVTLIVNISEVRTERVIENVPVELIGAPPRVHALPKSVKVTVYGARSAVEALTQADVSVVVEYQAGLKEFVPRITLSPAFADRVTVRAIEPQRVRVR